MEEEEKQKMLAVLNEAVRFGAQQIKFIDSTIESLGGAVAINSGGPFAQLLLMQMAEKKKVIARLARTQEEIEYFERTEAADVDMNARVERMKSQSE